MHFKLIIALVEDSETHAVLEAARNAGATVFINNVLSNTPPLSTYIYNIRI